MVCFAEALKVDDLPLPQELDGVPHVGVVCETTFLPDGRQKQLWALKIPVYLDGDIPCPWNPLAHQDVVDKLFYNVPG